MQGLKKYHVKLFTALVSKVQLNHRTLTRIIPDLIFDMWENRDLLPELWAPQLLGWPEPKKAPSFSYSYQEVKEYAKKHTKKFTPGLLATLLLYFNTAPAATEQLARYYAIDPKKLRKKAAAEMKEEERKAREPKQPETQKEKQLWHAVHSYADAERRWAALRKKGATDARLREVIKEEMGDGSYGSKADGRVSYKGAIPAVWFNKDAHSGPPSLSGSALVQAVRDLLKIPYPGDVDA